MASGSAGMIAIVVGASAILLGVGAHTAMSAVGGAAAAAHAAAAAAAQHVGDLESSMETESSFMEADSGDIFYLPESRAAHGVLLR